MKDFSVADSGSVLLRAAVRHWKTLLVLLLFVVLRTALTYTSGASGLVSPDGSLDFATATLVLAVLALRIGVLFLILPALAYRLTAAALGGSSHR